MPAIVRVLAADAIDNTAKQSWQKLIDREQQGGLSSLLSSQDRFDFDCILHAWLHRELSPAEWDVLVSRFSTHDARRVASIGRLVPRIVSPAPPLFVYKAVTAWAIPKMKGKEGKRSTAMLILPAEFYDINTWDTEGRPESTRSRWRRDINKRLEALQEQAVVHVTEILEREQLLVA
jgi:hypothetical protein